MVNATAVQPSCYGCTWIVWRALKKLELLLAIASSNSYASFIVSCGYSTKFCTRRLRPEVQRLTLLYTIFDRKATPSVYLPLKSGTPFTYLLKNTASLF